MTERLFKRVDDVVQREVAGELFLVPIRGHLADLQELFVLNEVGHWLWSRLDGTLSLATLTDQLVTEFEVDRPQAQDDVDAFIRQLDEAGLLQELTPPGE